MRRNPSLRCRPVRFLLLLVLAVASACGAPDAPEPAMPESPAPTGSPGAGAAIPGGADAQARPVPRRPAPPPANLARELRGVWVHLFDDTLKSPASVEAMLDAGAAANLNSVIVEVSRRQDAYYASSVLPRTTDPELTAGFDVLRAAVDGGHRRGLAVHAWYPALTAHHPVYTEIPNPRGWVWDRHGPSAAIPDRWVTRSHEGTWGEYLDPGVPAVVDHVAAVAAELAASGADAVHLDYVRYPGVEWGYHPVALDRFRRETGRSGVPPPDDPEWSAWRRAQVDRLVERAGEAVRGVSPDVGLSAAVVCWGEGPARAGGFTGTRPYRDALQNWPTWVSRGLVDALFPMVYFEEDANAAWFDDWTTFAGELAALHDTVVAVGQGAYLNPVPASLDQLREGLSRTDGVVVYSYQQNAGDEPFGALLPRLPRELFTAPAVPPDLS